VSVVKGVVLILKDGKRLSMNKTSFQKNWLLKPQRLKRVKWFIFKVNNGWKAYNYPAFKKASNTYFKMRKG